MKSPNKMSGRTNVAKNPFVPSSEKRVSRRGKLEDVEFTEVRESILHRERELRKAARQNLLTREL